MVLSCDMSSTCAFRPPLYTAVKAQGVLGLVEIQASALRTLQMDGGIAMESSLRDEGQMQRVTIVKLYITAEASVMNISFKATNTYRPLTECIITRT